MTNPPPGAADEHDDDIESVVHEDAETETDSYPNTGDELDDPGAIDSRDDPDSSLDDDPAEL
jgi:hypothetical protein